MVLADDLQLGKKMAVGETALHVVRFRCLHVGLRSPPQGLNNLP